MNQHFLGWEAVSNTLRDRADALDQKAKENAALVRLNVGQRDSLRAIASRIAQNGVLIADEVGMGKTRIAVEVARSVGACGGRVAILLPPGLGFQWQAELRDGGVPDTPPILRSLHAYLAAWDADVAEKQQPWFEKKTVMVSHAFTNWRLGKHADPWRFALVPELYARWRKKIGERLPRGYNDNEALYYRWPRSAAESIAGAIPLDEDHPVRRLLAKLLREIEWPRPLDATEYGKDCELRLWLERCVGVGFGVFDLVIIDEAHKSRGTESGLSRLLENVVMPSEMGRRLALTATPVELDVTQWDNTLRRLGLPEAALSAVTDASLMYADAVARVRHSWRTSSEARNTYRVAAAAFQRVLSPYLIRRDKREDEDVQRFHRVSQLPISAYRQEKEVLVETTDLSEPWRMAICAAESLSVVTRQSEDAIAKRLRLTLGSGHGIAVLLDAVKRSEEDAMQEAWDERERKQEHDELLSGTDAPGGAESKREERAKWWLNVLQPAFSGGDDALFDHPAIGGAVRTIEEITGRGEKVLVFGRFVRPLRALVEILNAREMLRRVQKDEPWPQSKVHRAADSNEWPAVQAAHRQLHSSLSLDTLDAELGARYDRESYRRERFREQLIPRIEQGLQESRAPALYTRIFGVFRRSGAESGAIALVARAMIELAEGIQEITASDTALLFCQLMDAVSDKDQGDDDREIDDDEVAEQWATIEQRLKEEYSRTQGGFARLMYGGTSVASRRMIQLAFNRPSSFPRVLVAQSMVGREGLNLHKSCRTVVILHPEWNPGVIEQQIGRVDRVGSHWCTALAEAINSGTPPDLLPRIEICPVIFQGTYDEHNWQVLRRRWDDLRAQLHGIVIRPSDSPQDEVGKQLVGEISSAAPSFSPSSKK
jgi:hypothetical protein